MPAFLKPTRMTIAGLLRKVQSVSLKELTGAIIASNTAKMEDLQRAQLLRGENNKGQPLPSILNDPYFTTPQKAKNYADWKQKLFPGSPYGIANYIVTGVYHGRISVKREGDSVTTTNSATFASDIASKNNNAELGLNEKSQEQAYWSVIRQPLIRQVNQIIGGKLK